MILSLKQIFLQIKLRLFSKRNFYFQEGMDSLPRVVFSLVLLSHFAVNMKLLPFHVSFFNKAGKHQRVHLLLYCKMSIPKRYQFCLSILPYIAPFMIHVLVSYEYNFLGMKERGLTFDLLHKGIREFPRFNKCDSCHYYFTS